MRERHNWAQKSHPSTCTCTICQARRLTPPPGKKKRKPKSMRGKGGAKSKAIDEAFEILGLSMPDEKPEQDDKKDV